MELASGFSTNAIDPFAGVNAQVNYNLNNMGAAGAASRADLAAQNQAALAAAGPTPYGYGFVGGYPSFGEAGNYGGQNDPFSSGYAPGSRGYSGATVPSYGGANPAGDVERGADLPNLSVDPFGGGSQSWVRDEIAREVQRQAAQQEALQNPYVAMGNFPPQERVDWNKHFNQITNNQQQNPYQETPGYDYTDPAIFNPAGGASGWGGAPATPDYQRLLGYNPNQAPQPAPGGWGQSTVPQGQQDQPQQQSSWDSPYDPVQARLDAMRGINSQASMGGGGGANAFNNNLVQTGPMTDQGSWIGATGGYGAAPSSGSIGQQDAYPGLSGWYDRTSGQDAGTAGWGGSPMGNSAGFGGTNLGNTGYDRMSGFGGSDSGTSMPYPGGYLDPAQDSNWFQRMFSGSPAGTSMSPFFQGLGDALRPTPGPTFDARWGSTNPAAGGDLSSQMQQAGSGLQQTLGITQEEIDRANQGYQGLYRSNESLFQPGRAFQNGFDPAASPFGSDNTLRGSDYYAGG